MFDVVVFECPDMLAEFGGVSVFGVAASISGHSKTTTSNTLFPGAFSHRTRRTTAQAKDVTSASKKNC